MSRGRSGRIILSVIFRCNPSINLTRGRFATTLDSPDSFLALIDHPQGKRVTLMNSPPNFIFVSNHGS